LQLIFAISYRFTLLRSWLDPLASQKWSSPDHVTVAEICFIEHAFLSITKVNIVILSWYLFDMNEKYKKVVDSYVTLFKQNAFISGLKPQVPSDRLATTVFTFGGSQVTVERLV
jgi:hypothetical protein